MHVALLKRTLQADPKNLKALEDLAWATDHVPTSFSWRGDKPVAGAIGTTKPEVKTGEVVSDDGGLEPLSYGEYWVCEGVIYIQVCSDKKCHTFDCQNPNHLETIEWDEGMEFQGMSE
jgi:hypothetical protein